MKVQYRSDVPSASDFKSLYDTTNWGPSGRSAVFYEAALQGSWCACSAYSDGKLVGFGRAISDGHLHAFFTEMIVLPAMQGQGIGRAILDALLTRCREAGITEIQLFCAEGKEGFYRKSGFVPRPGSMPGMQLVV